MVNKLGMTGEQEQQFLNPIIKFIKENPNLVKELLQKNDSKTQNQSSEK